MRRMRVNGGFWLAYALNLLFRLEGTIPAWILLILHKIIDLPIKWFWIALGIWGGGILLWTVIAGRFYSWAAKCGNTPDPPKPNRNPYSVGAAQQTTLPTESTKTDRDQP